MMHDGMGGMMAGMGLVWLLLIVVVALAIAALPSVLWHPNDRILLGVSGGIFVLLCLGMLLWIKPLSAADIAMLTEVNPRVAKRVRWFARKAHA